MKATALLPILVASATFCHAAVLPVHISPPGTSPATGLSPANEVPAVTGSTAGGDAVMAGLSFDSGSGLLDLNIGYGAMFGFGNLSGPPLGIAIHGPAGPDANGPAVVDLSPFHLAVGGPFGGGIILGSVTLDAEQTSWLLAGLLYVNISTPSFPAGELRGQLVAELPTVNAPPTLSGPGDVAVECTSSNGTAVTLTANVADANNDPLTVIWTVDGVDYQTNSLPADQTSAATAVEFAALFSPGGHEVVVSASDGHNPPVTSTNTVSVVDTTAPAITRVTPSPRVLLVPNHRMVPVRLRVEATDACGPVSARILAVSSNEPADGHGDGHTQPDWEITGPLSVKLRAERSGKGSGRIYTITVEARDAAGNTSTQTTEVYVPKGRSSGR